MTAERVTPSQALAMLTRVHHRLTPPDRRIVVELARQMEEADKAGATWEQTSARSVVLSQQGGVIFGREVLLALVARGHERPLLVDRDASLAPHLHEVDPDMEQAVAADGVHLDNPLTIRVWMRPAGSAPVVGP